MTRAEIESLLPGIFQRTLREGAPLAALLDAMDALHAPALAALADIDAVFDPRRTPDRFVPWLAGWLDVRLPMATGHGLLREVIAAAAYLSQWRGTSRGLLLFLETATGVQGFAVDEDAGGEGGRPRRFHILVRAPAETAPRRALIERIIEIEKPAHLTHELRFEEPHPGAP